MEAIGHGRISWDLSIRTQYMPGIELGCHITLTNPTNISRLYRVIARTVSNGVITTEDIVLIDGGEQFTLEAGQTLELSGSVTPAATDCFLELDLHEKDTGEIVSNCVTYLYSHESELRAIYEALAAQNIVGSITSVVTVMMIANIGILMAKGVKK